MRPASLPDPAADFEVEALSHLRALLGVASRLTRDRSQAEDLVQDTFLKAVRSREQYQPGTNMKGWLLRILTNTFINRYRRGGLERGMLEGPEADPVADGWVATSTLEAMRDPEALALRPMFQAEIGRALDQLPEDYRLAVVLADVEELSYKEIADIMGCPIGTVMSRLHRGRRLLKTSLAHHARALGFATAEPEHPETPAAPVDLATFRARKAVGS